MLKRKLKLLCVTLAAALICAIPAAGCAGDPAAFEAPAFADGADVRTFAAEAVPAGLSGEVDLSEIRLCPGGFPFGIKMNTEGILIVELSSVETSEGAVSPGRDAGLCAGDVITEIGGATVSDADELKDAVRKSGGKPISLTVKRGESEFETTAAPALSLPDKEYRLGVCVKSRAAGIGTVTFVDPEDGSFGGLGHGVCDADTGTLLPLADGELYDVRIDGVRKGKPGFPGELCGYFCSGKVGSLYGNTCFGVFGVRASLPKGIGETVELCPRSELHTGQAFIICTVDGAEPKEYSVNISEIDVKNDSARNFIIEIADPALIEATGGIVQGMSGSPVIQDGRLAGALTHVLVNDPTRGYGVFIENMIAAS